MSGQVQMYHGDCLEVMPRLAKGSVAMMFADLPYRSAHRKTSDMSWDVAIDMQRFWAQAWSLLADGVCVMTATQPFASMLVCQKISHFRYDVIWEKNNIGGWFNANRAPLRKHEHILIFCKRMPTYHAQKVAGLPYRQLPRPPTKVFAARQTRNTISSATINTGSRFPTSIQSFGNRECGMHPTQKPAAMLEWLIKTYTNTGDLVIDPASGSATTAIAALRTGRRAICIEKDPTYFAIGKARVEAEQARLAASAA